MIFFLADSFHCSSQVLKNADSVTSYGYWCNFECSMQGCCLTGAR